MPVTQLLHLYDYIHNGTRYSDTFTRRTSTDRPNTSLRSRGHGDPCGKHRTRAVWVSHLCVSTHMRYARSGCEGVVGVTTGCFASDERRSSRDVHHGRRVTARTSVLQRRTPRPERFEISLPARGLDSAGNNWRISAAFAGGLTLCAVGDRQARHAYHRQIGVDSGLQATARSSE